MSVHVVVGAQWGDEGKGKIVDVLSEHVDVVARYQGGNNAGHTVEAGGRRYILHLVPSGIFHDRVTAVLGNGVVIDPVALLEEIDELRASGIEVEGRLVISTNAHVILPYHKVMDALHEKGPVAIGTTGKGIGPAYTDKIARTGIRMADLLDEKRFRSLVRRSVEEKNHLLHAHGVDPIDEEEIISLVRGLVPRLVPLIGNTTHLLHKAIAEGRDILCEGAQGALLDIDHGTYPFVTSSSPTSGGAMTGLGIPPTAVSCVTGIAKAYCTRVGNGPFPTELRDELGEHLRTKGHEYGSTTGRPRRCGWLDIPALTYSIRINGIDSIALMKLDVLDELESIKVCTHYEIDGEMTSIYPIDAEILSRIVPVFADFPGWKSSLCKCTAKEQLPSAARAYIEAIENMCGVPVSFVSVGPEREQTIAFHEQVI